MPAADEVTFRCVVTVEATLTLQEVYDLDWDYEKGSLGREPTPGDVPDFVRRALNEQYHGKLRDFLQEWWIVKDPWEFAQDGSVTHVSLEVRGEPVGEYPPKELPKSEPNQPTE